MFCKSTNGYCKVFLFLAALAFMAGLASAGLTVNLVSPADGAITNSTTLTYNYTANASGTANCSLYANGVLNLKDDLANDTNWAVEVSPNVNYTWNVTCVHSNDTVVTTTNTSATRTVLIDTAAPTCSLLTITTTPPYGYFNSTTSTLFYNNASGGNFTVSVNATDVLSGVVNVTFPSITTLPTPGGANTTMPYNWIYSWNATSNASGSQQMTCRDNAGNTNFSSFSLNLDNGAPNITSASVTEPDIFYSGYTGNDIIHFNVNVTDAGAGITYIQADLANMTGTVNTSVNLTYNGTSGLWYGSFDVSSLLASLPFAQEMPVIPYNVNLYPHDNVNNMYFGQPPNGSVISTLMEDLGRFQGPPAGISACFREGTASEGQTNMSRILNFNAVNLVMVGYLNGSQACNLQFSGVNQSLPWGDAFRKMGKFNFTSVDMGTQEKASAVMGAMGNLIQIQIASPRSFRPSRIYVNTTNMSALNTSATVDIYDLPFASAPNVTYDDGVASVNISWVQGAYSSMFNSSVGNLTIQVGAFSGYNFTDEVNPVITINQPTSTTTSMVVNVTLNGTGTEISAAYFYINGTQVANYTNTTNSANCANASFGSEIWNCIFTSSASLGPHNLTVVAYDYGNVSPGNNATASIEYIITGSPGTVNLGSASNFVILSKTSIANTPTSAITGNIGVSPITGAAITGLDCAEVNGTIYTVDAAGPACRVVDPTILSTAVSDMETAYTTAAGLPNPTATELYSGNLGGRTLAAGIYKWSTGVIIPTDLTLTGNSTDVWVFQIAGNLDISPATSVILAGTANAKNIFWAVAGTTKLQTTSVFNGNILAGPGTSTISMDGSATLNGRALGQKAVTLDGGSNTVSLPSGALTVALNSPAAGFNTSSTSVTFNFTATSEGTTNCSLFVDGVLNRSNSSVASAIATTFTVPGFSNGAHNWSVACNDTLTTASSATRNFTVDTVAPTLAIQVPAANSKVTTNTTPVNFTASDATTGVAYCEYSINGTLINTSSCANFTLNLTDGTKNLYLYATDFAGNRGSASVTFLADNSSSSNVPMNTTTSVTTAGSQVMVGASSPAGNITTSLAATNVVLNASSLYSNTTFSLTLPSAITVNATTSLGNVIVQMPANLTMSGGSDWRGSCLLPMVVPGNPSAYPTNLGTNTVTGVIEICVSGTAITFDKGVRILLPGKGGQNAGYSRGTVFAQITPACSADTQTAGDALAAGADCVTSSGSDMVIWTKHFTQFMSYTTYNPSSSGGSSNSGGGSTGGGTSVGSSSNTTTYDTGSGTVQLSYTRTVEYDATTGKSTYRLTIVNDGAVDTGPLSVKESIPNSVAAVSGDLTFSLQPDAFGYAPVSAQWNLQNGIAAHQTFAVYYSVAKQTHVLSGFDLAFSRFSVPGSETPVPGSDRDEHGCIPSAGYTWCEAKQKCLRTWEEECTAAAPTTPTTPAAPTAPTQPAKPAETPVQPEAPAQPQPSAGLSGIVLGGMALAVIVVVAAVAYFVLSKKKKRGL